MGDRVQSFLLRGIHHQKSLVTSVLEVPISTVLRELVRKANGWATPQVY